MSYQVLARRWRPARFSELVGQEHVVRALGNALESGRLHHAYLFTGTRGVGKTTIARILAKSLNCERGITTDPCGECRVCREVDEGRFVDLIEVDAASKTGVDDTRELLENVPFAPVQGRYKVYLIDEVHMFSRHSFNALLKTLEEPPPHVKFLLATTDPQKVPVTILSRCLQFALRRLSIEQIRGQFVHILDAEGIEYDTEALTLLARAADGSMRDGLSLLDQAIAFGGGSVRRDAVADMLGVHTGELLPDLLEHVVRGDGAALLEGVDALAEYAPDFTALLDALLLLLHRVAVVQAVPDAGSEEWAWYERIRRFAERIEPETVQLYYQILLTGRRDLPLAPDARSGFEMVLLRLLAFRPDTVPPTDGGSAPRETPRGGAGAVRGDAGGTASASSGEAPKASAQAPDRVPAAGLDPDDWAGTVGRLGLDGLAAQLARHSAVREWDGTTLTLFAEPGVRPMLGTSAERRLVEALERLAGRPVRLRWSDAEPDADTPAARERRARVERERRVREDIAADPLVLALQERFDAELVESSIRPVESIPEKREGA